MARVEYDCPTCKDWGTIEDDTLCPEKGCPARARRVAGAQRVASGQRAARYAGLRTLDDTLPLPPRTAA